MKKFKKILSLMLALVLCFSFGISACAIESAGAEEIMSTEDESRILETYTAEFSLISAVSGCDIEKIDTTTIDTIKTVAFGKDFNDPNYNFEKMMEDIAVATVYYDRSKIPAPHGTIVPGTHKVTTLKTGHLKSEIKDQLPVGVTTSYGYNNSITISAGADIAGNKLTTQVTVSSTITKSFSGPTDGTKLMNGLYATDRIVFSVLSGTLVREEMDYINDYGGLDHIESVYVVKSTQTSSLHSILASYSVSANQFCNENQARTQTYGFSSRDDARDDIIDTPDNYI